MYSAVPVQNRSSTRLFNAFLPGILDFISAAKLWRMALYLGTEDIRQRYVRTFLGPLWLIIGTTLWIVIMSVVMASLFGSKVSDVFLFIASGMILWTFMSSALQEGAQIFIQSANVINSINLPMSLHVCRFVVRNFIIFLHNCLILVVIFIFFHIKLNASMLLAIPGLLLLLINIFWIGALIGLINARFRDVQQLITTSLAILPFVTPIFWQKDFLKDRTWIAMLNPFYHAIEIVRTPLLGKGINIVSWNIMLGITLTGIILTLYVFSKCKNRVIFWI